MHGDRTTQPGVAWSRSVSASDPEMGDPVDPLVEELPAATEAFAVFQSLADLPHLLFLDSAVTDPDRGRYSWVMADPFAWIVVPAGQDPTRVSDPFCLVAERLAPYRTRSQRGLPPFQGGAAGLFSYELNRYLERLPRPAHDEFRIPDLAIGLYDTVVAFDHYEGRAWLVSTGFPERAGVARQRRAETRLRLFRERLRNPRPIAVRRAQGGRIDPPRAVSVDRFPGLFSSFDRQSYLAAARRAVEYIHAGDCFQVNLAQRLLFPLHEEPLHLYQRLREHNAAPFGCYFDLDSFVIASSSPERFVRVKDRAVETRPIKGTRPRKTDATEDQRSRAELQQSAKDRAENVMIVDLMRNDLGRVCSFGSIDVPALCRLETFQHVHHLVSIVRGRLREGRGPLDLLRATFPGGSVTGAPRIRAMEIITELEQVARGAYCGCMGYLGFDGIMDTSILIRTMTLGKGWIQLPVGGGIVADSVPEQEYEETWIKAEGLLRALDPERQGNRS